MCSATEWCPNHVRGWWRRNRDARMLRDSLSFAIGGPVWCFHTPTPICGICEIHLHWRLVDEHFPYVFCFFWFLLPSYQFSCRQRVSVGDQCCTTETVMNLWIGGCHKELIFFQWCRIAHQNSRLNGRSLYTHITHFINCINCALKCFATSSILTATAAISMHESSVNFSESMFSRSNYLDITNRLNKWILIEPKSFIDFLRWH